jgi:hypothetical protein
MAYSIAITDDYTVPAGPLKTNEDYLTFVLNMAAKDYATQYGAPTSDAGVTAARETYNAALPQTEEPA